MCLPGAATIAARPRKFYTIQHQAVQLSPEGPVRQQAWVPEAAWLRDATAALVVPAPTDKPHDSVLLYSSTARKYGKSQSIQAVKVYSTARIARRRVVRAANEQVETGPEDHLCNQPIRPALYQAPLTNPGCFKYSPVGLF
jgi:hypothetical protein